MDPTAWFDDREVVRALLDRIDAPEIASLAPARKVMRRAVETITSFAQTFVPARRDDSHLALGWRDRASSLASQLGRGRAEGLRLALRVSDRCIGIVDEEEGELERVAIEGKTLDELRGAIATSIARHRNLAEVPKLAPPSERATDDGSPLPTLDPASCRSLAEWFGLAEAVTETVAMALTGAGPVRCWPQAFQVSTSVVVNERYAITLGASPGDAGIQEPFWYVAAWSSPGPTNLGAVLRGRARGDRRTAAWLPMRELLNARTGSERAHRLEEFFRSTFARARRQCRTPAPRQLRAP